MAKETKKKVTIKGKKGQKPLSFKAGGLHESTNTLPDMPIPAAKMNAAMAGHMGPLAKKQAVLAKGMLAKGRKTAAKNKRKGG